LRVDADQGPFSVNRASAVIMRIEQDDETQLAGRADATVKFSDILRVQVAEQLRLDALPFKRRRMIFSPLPWK